MHQLSLFGVGIARENAKPRIVDSDMHDVGRFLNRILGLPPDIQNRSDVLIIRVISILPLELG